MLSIKGAISNLYAKGRYYFNKEKRLSRLDDLIQKHYQEKEGLFYRDVFDPLDLNEFYEENIFETKPIRIAFFYSVYLISSRFKAHSKILVKYDKLNHSRENNEDDLLLVMNRLAIFYIKKISHPNIMSIESLHEDYWNVYVFYGFSSTKVTLLYLTC